MDLLVQNWIVAAAMTLLIIAIFFLLSKYYFRRRHTYLNNVRDLAIHPDNYRLYFLVLGIFFPATEIFMEIFKVRTKSALASSVIFGVFSIVLFLGSRYINVLRATMHKIFLGFYVVYSAFIFYNISIYPTDLPALVEFTLVVMFAHYAFYSARQFATYIILAFIVLLGMNLVGMVGIKFLVLYYNIILIATALNYTKYVVDLNIRKNLFWAYNIVNKGSLLVFGINKEGKIAFVSDNVKNILGYEKAEFVSKKWPHDITDIFDKTQPDGLTEGADTKYHLQRIKSKKEGYQLIEWQEDAVYEDLTIKVGRDVTAIKQAEDELRQTNARLKTLLTSSGDFLFVLNRDLVFTEYYNFNEGAENSARPHSFFIGKKLSDIGYPAAAFEHFSEAITRMLGTRERTTVEYCLPFPDGEKWFSVVISTPFNADGFIREIVCVARNITEQKRSEIELKRTKEVLEQTSRVASVGGWEYNLSTNKVYASKVAVAIHELPDNSVLDVEIVLDFYKEGPNRDTIKAAVKKIIEDGIPIDVELQLITAKGKEIWVRTIAHAEFAGQACTKLYGTIQDITARKVAEMEFRKLSTLHQTLIDNVPGYIFCKDYEGRFIFVSKLVAEVFKRTPQEIIGTTDFDHHKDDEIIAAYLAADRQVIDSGMPLFIAEEPNIRKDGSSGIFQTLKVPVEIPGVEKGYVFGVSTDITERKKIEETLIANQQGLRYKSELLSAMTKVTEKILISKNIQESLLDTFPIIGNAIKADRVYFFENDISTNLVSQKIEWVAATVSSEINNPNLQNMLLKDLGAYLTPILENRPIQCLVRELGGSKLKQVLEDQKILSLLVLPIFIRNTFYGFIGFDDCQKERIWSADELNILQSLTTNIANGIESANHERIIHESENNFRQINETIEDVFWLYDTVHEKYIYISPSCKNILDADQAYFYGGHSYVQDYIVEEYREIAAYKESHFLQKKPSAIEYKIKTQRGQIKWIYQKSFAIKDEQGKLVRLSGICSDITEKKQAELAREQHQEVLELHNRILTQVSSTPFDQYGSLENCLQAIAEATVEGLNVNRASIWDYTGSTLICRDLYEQSTRQHSADMVLVAKDFPAYFEGIQSDLAIVADDAHTNQYTFEFAEVYLRPLGIKSMLDVPIRIGGKLVGVLCCEHTGAAFKNWTEDDIVFARSMADIVSLALEADKRQKAEIELKKSQRAYEDLVTTIPVGVFKYGRVLGGDNKLLYVSPRLCEICGLSASELLHTLTVPEKLFGKEDILIFAQAVKEAVKHKKTFEWEGKLLTGDGGRMARLEGRPHQSENGDFIWNGIMYDITDRKRAEMELLATKERLESLIEAIPDAIFFKDGAGKWLVTNEDAKKVFNLHNFDWLGKTDLEMAVINPALREEYEICLGNDEKTWHNNKLSIYTEYFKDEQGIPREHEIRKMPVYNQDGSRKAMVIIGTDVTERRMVEEQLQQNLAALKSTQEKLIATQIEQEKFVSLIKYSDAFIAIADMTGKAFFLNEKAKIMSGYGNAYQHTYVRDYHSKAARKLLKETINDVVMNTGIWRGEFDVVNAKTQEVFVTDATMYIIHDPVSQEPIALATVQIDITERKQAEQELLQAKQQAEAANRAKSEFLANMSHELRTPLNGVIGFTDLLLKTKLDNIQQEYMSLVHKSANALLEVINDILDFSKIESGKLELEIERVELAAIGSQVVEAITYQAQHKKLKVWLHIAPTTPCYIWADSVRLKQVLINLLGNATKFTAQGEIELKVEVLSEETAEKTRFRFSVKDTGIGIKPENQQKIFEAFSQEDASTTRRFGGTGLGLAISNKLLSLMGSRLQLKSEPGKGSTFYFDVTFRSMDCDDAAGQNYSRQLPGILADATTLLQEAVLVRPEIAGEAHFDLAEFKNRIGENAGMVNGLLYLIQEHLETFPAELRQHIADQNLPAIKKAANSLKSTASSACFGLLLQQARTLEAFSFFDDAAINALYGEISAEIQHVKSLLAVHLQ